MVCVTTPLEQNTAALCAQAAWPREGDDEIGSLHEVLPAGEQRLVELLGKQPAQLGL